MCTTLKRVTGLGPNLRLLDVATNAQVQSWDGLGKVEEVVWSPDGAKLAVEPTPVSQYMHKRRQLETRGEALVVALHYGYLWRCANTYGATFWFRSPADI